MDIAILDETVGLEREAVLSIAVEKPIITARELIELRIELEIEHLELAQIDSAKRDERANALYLEKVKRFLVIPDCLEKQLNGDRGAYGPGTKSLPMRTDNREVLKPDINAMVEAAFSAFERGGFFLLAGDRQILDLDEELSFPDTAEVTFLKITPLQGG
jgi:hypothetical protein